MGLKPAPNANLLLHKHFSCSHGGMGESYVKAVDKKSGAVAI